jgi:telomerase reverse transcriptase
MLTEPALATLRVNMFDEMPRENMSKLLSARQLGSSNIRLLPKGQGFRTIMNLKRRQQVLRHGTMSLGRSINAVMAPVFNALTYEKVSTFVNALTLILTSDRRYGPINLVLRYSL